MLRGNDVGKFHVEFEFLTRPYGKPLDDEYTTPIGLVGPAYEDRDGGRVEIEPQPKVSNRKPYEGALTQHELDWLLSLPGVEYNSSYRFTVTALDEAADAAIAAH